MKFSHKMGKKKTEKKKRLICRWEYVCNYYDPETGEKVENPTEEQIQDAEDEDSDVISSFNWNITGSYKTPIPSMVNPWLTEFSLSSLTASAVFTAVNNTAFTDSTLDTYDTAYLGTYSPERKFFYPSSVTPLKLSLSISGTIFEYPPSSSKKSSSKAPSFPVSLTAPAIISELNSSSGGTAEEEAEDESESVDDGSESDKDNEEKEEKSEEEKSDEEMTEEEKQKKEEEKAEEEKEAKDAEIEKETGLPKITLGNFSTTAFAGWHYALTYAIKPVYTSQVTYATPTIPSDFSWNEYKSTFSISPRPPRSPARFLTIHRCLRRPTRSRLRPSFRSTRI